MWKVHFAFRTMVILYGLVFDAFSAQVEMPQKFYRAAWASSPQTLAKPEKIVRSALGPWRHDAMTGWVSGLGLWFWVVLGFHVLIYVPLTLSPGLVKVQLKNICCKYYASVWINLKVSSTRMYTCSSVSKVIYHLQARLFQWFSWASRPTDTMPRTQSSRAIQLKQ